MQGGDASISLSTIVIIALNGLLGIASLFGAAWLRRMEKDMDSMRDQLTNQQKEFHEKLDGKVGREDFNEYRRELRENFREVFTRMDGLKDQISTKADRP
jgi:hypothetical protein